MRTNRRTKLLDVGRNAKITLRRAAKKVPFQLTVHPLFLAAGVWYCFIGKLPLFFISAIIALQHECAHAFAAARLGYRLNRVVLMPYGAVIDGDLSGISLKDEAFVALCGPLVNLSTAAFFVALWWVFPSLYPYTDVACYASAFIGLLNLLPCYPLDGGRILRSLLERAFLKKHPPMVARKRAKGWCIALSFLVCALLCLLFVLLWIRGTFNLTLLAFALFLAVGSIGHGKEKAAYHRIDYSFKNAFARGVCIRHIAVDDRFSLKQALCFLDERSYVSFEIFDKEENLVGILPQNLLAEKFESANLYAPLADLL